MKKHPKVFEKGSKIPLNDLLADPVVFYQKKYISDLALILEYINIRNKINLFLTKF